MYLTETREDSRRCHGCSLPLQSKYIFSLEKVLRLSESAEFYHPKCLICSQCNSLINDDDEDRCFVKQESGEIICVRCHNHLNKCFKCSAIMDSNTWVFKLRSHAFHLSCFTCSKCHRQLCQGECCLLQVETRQLLCVEHLSTDYMTNSVNKSNKIDKDPVTKFQKIDTQDHFIKDFGFHMGESRNQSFRNQLLEEVTTLKQCESSISETGVKFLTINSNITDSNLINLTRNQNDLEEIRNIKDICQIDKELLVETENLEDRNLLMDDLDHYSTSSEGNHNFNLTKNIHESSTTSYCMSLGNNQRRRGASNSQGSSSSGFGPKTKRIRTSFTPDQLAILQANFDLEANPDGQELERIANSANLNKRVTQVWFQNARARKKKSEKHGCLEYYYHNSEDQFIASSPNCAVANTVMNSNLSDCNSNLEKTNSLTENDAIL